jgi:hypothetical protein
MIEEAWCSSLVLLMQRKTLEAVGDVDDQGGEVPLLVVSMSMELPGSHRRCRRLGR